MSATEELTEIEGLKAELGVERITGVMFNDPEQRMLDIPLISHIEGNLWMGGYSDGVKLPDSFTHVFSLYPWHKYQTGPNTITISAELYDNERGVDERKVMRMASLLNEVRWNVPNDEQILVHCQAGINRSGLVLVAAMMTDVWNPVDVEEALALVRERRSPVVLSNQTFVDWLFEEERELYGER